jgi:Mg2+ and Co2+ transporter CorA
VAEQVRHDESLRSSTGVFITLLEALVDRGADVLERLGSELDKISTSVFRGDPNKRRHTVHSNQALRGYRSLPSSELRLATTSAAMAGVRNGACPTAA